MKESYIRYNHAYCYMRHTPLRSHRKTLLFLHGIGDSSLSYEQYLQVFDNVNILIPDFLGYGKSSKYDDYHFKVQIAALIEQINSLEQAYKVTLDDIILIPHSMAAIHAVLLCHSMIKEKIKGIINIEGSITQYGSFISEEASRAYQQETFDAWFDKFREITIFNKLLHQFPICRSYYASLKFCQAKAFLENALEIRQFCLAGTGEYTNIAGLNYAELDLPKIYCYGDKSLCQESIEFLNKKRLKTKTFHTANHFLMLECFDEFVDFVTNWVSLHG